MRPLWEELPNSEHKRQALNRVPLGTLVHGGQFLLIAGEEGHAWVEAAEKIAAERGLPLRATRVGVLGSDYVDVRCS